MITNVGSRDFVFLMLQTSVFRFINNYGSRNENAFLISAVKLFYLMNNCKVLSRAVEKLRTLSI